MKILNVTQGSPEWHAARAAHFCASDAPAMMGASKYKSRNDLIREKATGLTEEITPEKQALFDKGHAAEAAIRPHVEKLIGDDLYPATATEGRLLASLDGMTMEEETLFEHKLWNQTVVAQIQRGELEPQYYWQLEHQLLVTKAKRVYFVCSDGTPDNCVSMIYVPVAGRAEKLLAGWAQFEADVAAYQHVEAPAKVVAAVESLPAVSVQVNGALQIVSNLGPFGAALKDFIGRIDMKPETDQAFAEAEAAIKTLGKAEDALSAAKASGLAQVATVDEMVRTLDSLNELARKTRLALEKMVKTRKDEIRTEIALRARLAWQEHVSGLNAKLVRVQISVAAPDFASAMKGKKTLTSLRAAVDDALAAAKVEANQQAKDYAANLAIIDEIAKDHSFLVRDLSDLVTINPQHLPGVLKGRIAEHEKAEAERLERERAKIRAEEEARARRDAEAKAEQERQRIRQEEQAKARAEQEQRERDARAARLESEARFGPEKLATAPAAAIPQPARPTLADMGKPRSAPSRPTDAEIIEVLSLHYRVHESKVVEWLCEMDLSAVEVQP